MKLLVPFVEKSLSFSCSECVLPSMGGIGSIFRRDIYAELVLFPIFL